MAPLRVAGLIEFHVLETEPDTERRYCIAVDQVKVGEITLALSRVAIDARGKITLALSRIAIEGQLRRVHSCRPRREDLELETKWSGIKADRR